MRNNEKQSIYEFLKQAWQLIEGDKPIPGYLKELGKLMEDYKNPKKENLIKETSSYSRNTAYGLGKGNHGKSIFIIDDPNDVPDNFRYIK